MCIGAYVYYKSKPSLRHPKWLDRYILEVKEGNGWEFVIILEKKDVSHTGENESRVGNKVIVLENFKTERFNRNSTKT